MIYRRCNIYFLNQIHLLCRRFSTRNTTKYQNRTRVVCTGIGITCPLGHGTQYAWSNLINNKIAVRLNSKEGFEKLPSKVAAFIPTGEKPGELNIFDYVKKSDLRHLSKSMIYALAAAEEAVTMADWKPERESCKQRTGVAIGCGMADLETIADTTKTLLESGYKKVSPYFVPKILTNMASGHVSIKYGFKGPNHSVSTACTTGAHAIGDSMRLIRNGDADVMICGGTEATIVPVAVAGFSRARALSTGFSENPETSSRPFDKDRDGFVIGEGAAILVLENIDHAVKRNAPIFGEILGYGLSGDAHHMTAAKEDGKGAFLSMTAALQDACLQVHNIDYVNAHATSTPIGDVIENKAIKELFAAHSYKLKVSSFKGAMGHLQGAAGAVETAFTVLSLHHKIIPPTMNLFSPGEGFDLDYVPNRSVEFPFPFDGKRRVALKNSFGFGGTHATLCLAEM